MACIIEDSQQLRYELIRAHKFKKGMDSDKAEEDFIVLAQTLPHYGGHFYTSVWVSTLLFSIHLRRTFCRDN